MDEALAKKLDDAFQAKMAEHQGKESPKAPEGSMLKGLELPALGSFCSVASAIIKMLLGVLNSFSWFIPNRPENMARAFLETLDETLLPNICPKP